MTLSITTFNAELSAICACSVAFFYWYCYAGRRYADAAILGGVDMLSVIMRLVVLLTVAAPPTPLANTKKKSLEHFLSVDMKL